MSDNPEDNEKSLSETEHYEAWVSQEPDGEPIYHLDLGRVTVHLFQEEWDELRDLFAGLDD